MKIITQVLLMVLTLSFAISAVADNTLQYQSMAVIVNKYIQPLMQKYQIPGISVGITFKGDDYFFNFGVLSKQSNKPITQDSLFGVGSITKLFTASLATYLDQTKKIDLNSDVASFLPTLNHSEFDHITLLNLLTHTSGLPLFVPTNNITNQNQLLTFLHQWKPSKPIGTERVYSNIGFGSYYRTQYMRQGLAWEEYAYPLTLQTLLQGHASELQATAYKLKPIYLPFQNIYLDKTGTGMDNSYACYVAFIPKEKIGIVILASKFYPFNERPKVGYEILQQVLRSS